jgi:hypothetical protein
MALFALFVVPMVLYESRAMRLREER